MNVGAEGSCVLFAGGMHVWQLMCDPEAGKNVEGKPRRRPKLSPGDGVQESFPSSALSGRGVGTVHKDAGVQDVNEPMRLSKTGSGCSP